MTGYNPLLGLLVDRLVAYIQVFAHLILTQPSLLNNLYPKINLLKSRVFRKERDLDMCSINATIS